jgi:hypothetical protein
MVNGLFTAGYRCDRLWLYQTLDNPPKLYLIASMYRFSTGFWELWYQRLSSSPGTWTIFPSLRSINSSQRAHEGVPARGKFYAKGYPNISTTETLGTVQFDGSPGTPTVRVWGALGPTIPARIRGAITYSTGAINDSTTALTVSPAAGPAGFPATPFTAQLDYEQVTVTSIGGGGNWTIVRAQNGTTAASHANGTLVLWRNWTASAHQVTVNLFWRYSYCYKTVTGQYTNRAPEETNPDLLPNSTGAFTDLCPEITIQGHADTTNFPTIVVLRTCDGGGTYFTLEEIPNTGAGNISYRDDSLGSGSSGLTQNDPIPDVVLNTFAQTPNLTSNSPPPSVIAPGVIGVNQIEPSTPCVYYASRIWYGMGNLVFYSANEELPIGVPEESFPSGLTGNFYRFQDPVTNLVDTGDALFIMTLKGAYIITGTTKDTFNLRPIYDQMGHPYNNSRAVVRYKNSIAFLTNDYKVATIIESNEPEFISDPLESDLVDEIVADAEVDMKYWADLDKEWMVVFSHRKDDTSLSRQRMYNTKLAKNHNKPFWATPWDIPTTAAVAGRASEDTSQTKLIMALFDNDTNTTRFVELDLAAFTDDAPAGERGYGYHFTTHLQQNPAGNHLNNLAVDSQVSDLNTMILERKVFDDEADPELVYYLDDTWTDPITPPAANGPPRREQSKGYKTLYFQVNTVCNRAAVTISSPDDQDDVPAQIETLTWVFQPGGGA